MKPQPRFTLAATTLDAPDAHELAQFYQDLLGWPVRKEEPGWVEIAPPTAVPGCRFRQSRTSPHRSGPPPGPTSR
ncbi:hypothetical protein OHO27_41690 [Streptomyces sp. NBC_00443]